MIEVLDSAPADLTPAQRLVLVVIAERAPDDTREAWAGGADKWGLDVIARRTGLKPDSVRKAIQQMARKGIEIRVPIKTGTDGRPVYAHEGQQTTFRIPRFIKRLDQDPPSEGGPGSTLSTQEGGPRSQEGGPRSQEGGPRSQEGGPRSTPNPHIPQYPSDTADDADVIPLFGSEGTTEEKPAKKGSRSKKPAPVDDPRFAAFYEALPCKEDRLAASRAWAETVKQGVSPDDLLFAAQGYREDPERSRIRKYIKTPVRFLRDGRYERYLPTHRPEDDMEEREMAGWRDYD